MVDIAHRGASGFVVFHTLGADSEMMWCHRGQGATRYSPADRGILGETGKNPIRTYAIGPQPPLRTVN